MADLTGDYLRNIGRYPLLTAAEEIELGNHIQKCIDAGDDATPGQRRLADRARRRMVTSNLRLVATVAKKFMRRAGVRDGMEYADLMQEGTIGLTRAVEKFDPARGYKFSTYAYWWIRQAISRAIAAKSRVVYLPCQVDAVLVKASSFSTQHQQAHGRPPSITETAEHCRVTEAQMRLYLSHASGTKSLDAKAGGKEDHSTLVDLVAADCGSPMESIALDAEAERVNEALDRLEESEANLIRRRFGIGREAGSLVEIGREMGISREAVRLRCEKGLRKLRFYLRSA